MRIEKAKSYGFCFGVRRAVELAESSRGGVTLGPLIHNPLEIERLKRDFNVGYLSSVEEIAKKIKGKQKGEGKEGEEEGGKGIKRVIIRTHGIPKGELEQLKKLGLEIVDATCPFVKKPQEIVEQMSKKGYDIVIFGDRNHPEIKGVMSYGINPKRIFIALEPEELEKVSLHQKVAVVAQTTRRVEEFEKLVKNLLKKVKELRVFNTICNATFENQEAVRELAKRADLVVVIGGKNSSNTRQLYKIASLYTKAYLVEGPDEVKSEWFKNRELCGISAGASTPDWLVEQVISKIKELTMEELKVGDVIQFKIKELVKGGFVGEVEGREVFLPKSLSGLKWDEKNVGKEIKAKVKEVKTNSIVADRKSYLREEEEKLEELKGQKVTATITEVRKNGLIIDINGIGGFIPKDEIFYKNIRVEDYFKVGESIEAVLVDPERRVFSIKRLLPNPWDDLKEVQPGDILEATVSHITKNGLFVELANGIEGFMHISEVNWEGENDLSVGDKIRVEVLEINPAEERLKVSRKRLLPKPAERFKQLHREGDVVEGVIVKFINSGAFVEIDGISVLLPNRFVSYKKGERAEDLFQIGDRAKFKIISIEPEDNKVVVSHKDTLEDPYTRFNRLHTLGDIVEGIVRNIRNFGMFVDLGEVEALVRKNDYMGTYRPGDRFRGEIVELKGDRIKLKELN